MRHRSLVIACVLALAPALARAEPLTLGFDFSRHAIGLDVAVKTTPLHVILDTGVDPSVIDLARAQSLGLTIDRAGAGEVTGEGDARSASAVPATFAGLTIGGRAVPPFAALALDMTGLSAQYGKKLDGVLGYSFLSDKIVLIDYATQRLAILDAPAQAAALAQTCRTRWPIALRSYQGDTIPIIPDFHIGAAAIPASLDTGSNGGIALFQSATTLPALAPILRPKGEAVFAGARGTGHGKTYILTAPVGFGPFSLPPGQIATAHPEPGSAATRMANLGNQFFAKMGLKLLLDYRARQVTFYGNCAP